MHAKSNRCELEGLVRFNRRVAGEGRHVIALPCPRSIARLQRSPIGRVESFRS